MLEIDSYVFDELECGISMCDQNSTDICFEKKISHETAFQMRQETEQVWWDF